MTFIWIIVFVIIIPVIFLFLNKKKEAKEQKIREEAEAEKQRIREEKNKQIEEDRRKREKEFQAAAKDREKKRQERDAYVKKLIDELPIFPVSISNKPCPVNRVSGVNEITFSNVTRATNPDTLSNYVVFDVETTGLNASSCEIVEIAAIRFREWEPVEKFYSLCKPKKGIPDEVVKIHGITEDMVENAPLFGQIATSFQTFIGSDNLVAHNLEFDLKFIYRYGVNILAQKRKYYDTN